MVMVRHWRQHFSRGRGARAVLVVVASLACGCKTGSWGAKPSWWSFGGSPPAGSALTAAPAFDQDPTKPSEAAKPYPTTSTPESYALNESTPPPGAAAETSSPVQPAAVTYGTTVASSTPQPDAGYPAAEIPGSTAAAQVGPYASLQQPAVASPSTTASSSPADPAAAATAGFAAAPAFAATEPSQSQQVSPPPAEERFADARGSTAWPAAASPPPTQAFSPDDRYGSTNGSRFSTSSGYQPAAVSPAAASPAMDALPAAVPMTIPDSPPAPASALPGALSPPTRRPDPGYRPGGTSSYRPNRAILADEEVSEGPVMPVSYQLPASGG